MDGRRFDALAKALVATGSRRGAMRVLAGLGVGVAGRLWPGHGRVTGAACKPGAKCRCKQVSKGCSSKAQCCSGLCSSKTNKCSCRKSGQPCTTDANCCSGDCNQRTGTCTCTPSKGACSIDQGCCTGQCAKVNAAGCNLEGTRCCRPLNATCEEDCECCEGVVGGETGCYLVNGTNRCCLRAGADGCKGGGACCGTAVCDELDGWSAYGKCCFPNGQPCTSSDQCCIQSSCVNSTCCGNTGSWCGGDDDKCCGSLVCGNTGCYDPS